MRRTFDLLTKPLADDEQVVVSANVSWPETTDFKIQMAPSVSQWFRTSVALFYKGRFSFSVRRVGRCDKLVRFSARVECMTNDKANQKNALVGCYWPPPDSVLFCDPVTATDTPTIDSRPALPIFLNPRSSITAGGMRVFLSDRGWPLAAIIEGPIAEDEDRLGLYVPFEFPLPLAMPKHKQAIEWIHLAAARQDLKRSDSTILHGDVIFGDDPPDFLLCRAIEPAVELVQFTHSDRRHELALTKDFRGMVCELPPSRFSHLGGHLILLGFDTPRGLPPKERDVDDVARMIMELEQYKCAPNFGTPVQGNPRDGFVVRLINTPLGDRNLDIFPLPVVPQTRLGVSHGFELATSYTTTTRLKDTEDELTRIVRMHDREKNDILLISAGAPGLSGLCLISDEVAVEPILLEYMNLPFPRHLKRILLHRWTFGDVYQLFPELRCLTTPVIPLSEGGPIVLPIRHIPGEIWEGPCPCRRHQRFSLCHGAQ